MAAGVFLVGYLVGSISPARFIGRWVDPTVDVTQATEVIPGTYETYVDTAVSGTVVNRKLGWRYGCLTSLLDMAKAIIPVLMVRSIWPDESLHLVAALGVVVGHNWPIYHRFRGGRGESSIYGTMLVLDPIAPVAANLAALVLGFLAGSTHLLRWGGIPLMAMWAWWRGNPSEALFVVGATAAYFLAMRGDFATYWRIRRRKVFATRAELTEFLDMGSELGAAMDRWSVPGLVSRIRTRQ